MFESKKFPYETVKQVCFDIFQKMGYSAEDADKLQESLLAADLFGIQSHGMQRLVRYPKSIEKGEIVVDAKPEVVFDTPVSAVVDGHRAAGQLTSIFAMELAIEKAKKSGVGIVSVRNSNHYGIASYYAKMASDQGLIGYSSTNSGVLVVPTGGAQPMMGTNPQGWAIPTDEEPFIFDAATSVVTKGKCEIYNKLQQPIPEGWAVNEHGQVETDASVVLSKLNKEKMGGILPLGGATTLTGSHKGYGYSMIVEFMTGILAQGVPSIGTYKDGVANVGHNFTVINPAFFGDPKEIRHSFTELLHAMRNSKKDDGVDRLYTHGELEAESEKRVREEGVPILEATMAEVKDLCDATGLDFSSYFGDYQPKRPEGMVDVY